MTFFHSVEMLGTTPYHVKNTLAKRSDFSGTTYKRDDFDFHIVNFPSLSKQYPI